MTNPVSKNIMKPQSLPGHPGADSYLAKLKTLDKTQWLRPRQLLSYQFDLLRPLLAHAYQNVPYYRQVLRAAGLHPSSITVENWHRVPILKRKTLQQLGIRSQQIPTHHGRLFERRSSGSTGHPVTVYKTDYTQHFFDLLSLRDCLWHKWDLHGKYASIRHFSGNDFPAEGVSLPGWGTPFDLLGDTGPAVMIRVRTPIKNQLQWLTEHQPDYLQTYPANLKALIEASQQAGITFPKLKAVRATSETLPQELRLMCKNTWGVPVTASYSSIEMGYLAIQCPVNEHYHVQSESALLEVLNDEGLPCAPGEIGRVVVTSLLNYATPLIRYEIQDYAEVGEQCACGRGLPVLTRVLGRERNMLTLPTGDRCWPIVSSSLYRKIAPVKQYQFIQHSVDLIEMRLITERDLSVAEQQALRELIQKSFGHPFDIKFTMCEAFPFGVNGKFEEFISRVGL